MKLLQEGVSPADPVGYGPSAYDELLRRADPRAIAHVAALGLAETGGREFLEAAARDVTHFPAVCCSYVAVLEDPEGTRARTVVRFEDGRRRDDVVFQVEGTAGSDVVGRNVCVFASARHRFPRDSMLAAADADWFLGVPLLDQTGEVIGVLAAMGRGEPGDTAEVLETMRLLAGRASLELERMLADRLADTERHLLEDLLVRRTAELGALKEAHPGRQDLREC
jgi:hypothetical protein